MPSSRVWEPSRRRTVGLLSAALCALLLLAFGGATSNGFIVFDDPGYITANRAVLRGLTTDGVRWAFTTTDQANWHPLTWLSHMLDVQLFGLNPAAHHAVGLALHGANALLLFLLLRAATGAVVPGFFAAAIFAAHPLRVESVVWASERKDLLSAFLLLVTLFAYGRLARRPGAGRLAAVTVLFVLAVLAKPMAVTLPLLLLVLDLWPLGRWRPGGGGGAAHALLPPPALLAEKVPLFLVAAVSGTITYQVQARAGAISSDDLLPLVARAANAAVSAVRYLDSLLFPRDLSPFYPHPGAAVAWGAAAAALATLAVITVAALAAFRRRPAVLAGWLWYLVSLLPVIGLVQSGSQARADRYGYLPLIGVAVALCFTAAQAARTRPRLRVPLVALGGVALLLHAGLAGLQTRLWRDDAALFGHALRLDPDNWMAHNVLGSSLAARGRWEEALGHFEAALRHNPANPHELTKVGAALNALGRPDEAIGPLEEAVALDPSHGPARRALGEALAARGDHEAALAAYEAAVGLEPGDAPLHNALGSSLAALGRHAEALGRYEEALRLDPGDADVLTNLGNSLDALGRRSEALERYREAIRRAPGHGGAHRNLGLALAAQGEVEAALLAFRDAVRLDPRSAASRTDLGRALVAAGLVPEAIEEYRRAIALEPRDALAHNNLGAALAALARYREAEAEFRRALELQPDLPAARANLERLARGASAGGGR